MLAGTLWVQLGQCTRSVNLESLGSFIDSIATSHVKTHDDTQKVPLSCKLQLTARTGRRVLQELVAPAAEDLPCNGLHSRLVGGGVERMFYFTQVSTIGVLPAPRTDNLGSHFGMEL